MSDELIVIFRARQSHHAHLLRNVLANYGIEATVTGDTLLNAGGEFIHAGGIPVVVRPADVKLAEHIANAFVRHVLQAEPNVEWDDEVRPSWPDWPICPQCRARQTAVCCHCDERGDDFALAEWQGPAAEPSEVLLVCPTCDDVFVPQFYRDCPWCGFHFGTGLDPQNPGEAYLTPRLGWFAFGLAVFVYLWFVTT